MTNEAARSALRRQAARHPEALDLVNRYMVTGDVELGDRIANLLSVLGESRVDETVRLAAGGIEPDEDEPEA